MGSGEGNRVNERRCERAGISLISSLARGSFTHPRSLHDSREECRPSQESEGLEQSSFFFPENLGRVTGKSLTSSGVADLSSIPYTFPTDTNKIQQLQGETPSTRFTKGQL